MQLGYQRRLGCVFVFACVVGVSVPEKSHAIVNVLNRSGLALKPGWGGQLDSALGWRTGNVDYLSLSGALKTYYQWDSGHAVVLDLQAAYDRLKDESFVSNRFAHLRYIFSLDGAWRIEMFTQYEYDEELDLQTRALVGIGPSWRLEIGDLGWLMVGSSYMFEYERALDAAQLPTYERERYHHRWNNFFVMRFGINDKVNAKLSAYVQPRWDDFKDVRALAEAALVVKLTSFLYWKTSFVATYDSDPFPGVDTTDTALKSGVRVRF